MKRQWHSSNPAADATDARTISVDVTQTPSGARAISVGGKQVPVAVLRTEAAVHGGGAQRITLKLGHRITTLSVARDGDAVRVVSADRECTLEQKKAHAGASGAGATQDVRAPMPGRVLRILVGPGEAVQKGSALLVMEAMKMENEIRAPGPGVVGKVHVSEGASVEAKALLISFV